MRSYSPNIAFANGFESNRTPFGRRIMTGSDVSRYLCGRRRRLHLRVVVVIITLVNIVFREQQNNLFRLQLVSTGGVVHSAPNLHAFVVD
jgi:hypothetical protein